MIKKTVAMYLLFNFVFSLSVQAELKCSNQSQLKSWIQGVKARAKKEKLNQKRLKKLYIGSSKKAVNYTLFSPEIFKDKILLASVTLNCNDNLVNLLRPKINAESKVFFKTQWQKCATELYDGNAPRIVGQVLKCID